ncbi:MAG: methyl-accepting chemotaxis protein [Selenomonas sp.]|uniref:methyl-accepting chemotaxis protein n=1 Tax=Selenomonas sp. TaxID=2053611 RepID=UPI0025F23651|nr:methyl-accepting chemotaxis protein [Selenomonas sp.]MCR5756527.1 methyl-accepting chemotaxis protein [Selenomonas sp.]
MRLREKFMVLTALAGLLVAIVSVIGYWNASEGLEKSVEKELMATVTGQTNNLNGWLLSYGQVAQGTANLINACNGNMELIKKPETLSLGDGNKDVLEVGVGLETGFIQGRNAGDMSAKLDPRTRGWYKLGRDKGVVTFTEAYLDKFTNKLVTSAVCPVKADGKFAGTVFVDILLETLDQQVGEINYNGVGSAAVIEPTGVIIASKGKAEKLSKFQDIPGLGSHFDEMVQNKQGFFTVDTGDDMGEAIIAYATVDSSGWLVSLAVPAEDVYAPLNKLKIIYLIVALGGMLVMALMCRKLAFDVTEPVTALEKNAKALAEGNLQVENIPVTTSDEIGNLTAAFNTMAGNLQKLIKQMAKTSEQLAASAEELTANSQQSAEASTHVAATVGDVSAGMDKQLQDIDGAKENVDMVFQDITKMAEKSKTVAEASIHTATAAKQGAEMMENAITKMGAIEQGVMESAEVVKKLGENSQQIDQIVDAISSIAEQTNLLSLNAAIEAARAGEHGRGFAVVAEEVRKLAAESQVSAEQIKARISSIQQDTVKAVESMERGSEGVKDGTKTIREVGAQFSDILSMVESINSQMTEINSSVKVVTDGASNIVTAVDSIDTVSRKTAGDTQTISSATEEQSASNEEIAASSTALVKLAEEMQHAIRQFKI